MQKTTKLSPPSMRKVAELAGVSVATVSNLLSNKKNSNMRASEATRQHVLAICKQVGYEPNIHAKRLFSKHSKILNLIFPPLQKLLPGMQSPDFNLAGIIQGVTAAASDQGYQIVLNPAEAGFFEKKQYLGLFRSRAVDGLLIWGVGFNDVYINEIAKEGIPFVMIQTVVSQATESGYAYVVSDSKKGAYRLIEYIISLGHRIIGCIRGFQTSSTGYDRWKGFFESMTAHNIYRQDLVFDGDYTFDSGQKGAAKLLKHCPEITAIACANNLMAAGAIRYITQQGLNVPNDISVTGYDGIRSCLIQPLTSSNDPIYDMGSIATKKLINFIKQPSRKTTIPNFQIVLDPELYVGSTTSKVKIHFNS